MISVVELIVIMFKGLYCLVGDFYIDFWWLVDCVVIMYVYSDYVCIGY